MTEPIRQPPRASRRFALAFGTALAVVTIVGASIATAAHPGTAGGLTYPVDVGIRVDALDDAGLYDLPIVGASDVSWTPDGRFLAFTRPGGDAPGLYVSDSAGCQVERLTADPLDRAPAFDGSSLYFTRGDATFELPYDLQASSSPVTGMPQPTEFGTDVEVSILEGRYAHVLQPGGSHPSEYLLMLEDPFLREHPVEVHRSVDPITGTEWAPDGSFLAFESTDDMGKRQVFVATAVGTIEVEQVTFGAQNAISPAYSPDGTQLAYIQTPLPRTGSGVVRVIDLDTRTHDFVSQQATGNLDWQPIVDPAPLRPTDTTLTITASASGGSPGLHDIVVTVSPTPNGGRVAISVNGAVVGESTVGPDGTATVIADIGDGDVIEATYDGSCPHQPSTASTVFTAPTPPPTETPSPSPTPTASPIATPSPAPTSPPSYPFADVTSSNQFHADIAWIADRGITAGCDTDRYCPKGAVTRAQMASFLVRALHLPAATGMDRFSDDEGNQHEAQINALAEAEITAGCDDGRFCPADPVTREQMATFLARAFGLQASPTDWFVDDDHSQHEGGINALRASGITRGCGPATFCPSGGVNREQMAAFLHRAIAR